MAVATSSDTRQHLCRAPLDNEPGVGAAQYQKHPTPCPHRQYAEPLVPPLARRSCGLKIKVARAQLKILGPGSSLLPRKPPHHAFGGVTSYAAAPVTAVESLAAVRMRTLPGDFR
jgi:hypothetical protein